MHVISVSDSQHLQRWSSCGSFSTNWAPPRPWKHCYHQLLTSKDHTAVLPIRLHIYTITVQSLQNDIHTKSYSQALFELKKIWQVIVFDILTNAKFPCIYVNFIPSIYNTRREVKNNSCQNTVYCWHNHVQYNQLNLSCRPAVVGWIWGVNCCP